MLPQRSALMVDTAAPASGAELPPTLTRHIVGMLPVDSRARAACVSSAWCSAVADGELWMRLDLSPSSGVRITVNDEVLQGAADKARGQLAALDVSDCEHLSPDVLLQVVETNGGTLRELRCGAAVDTDQTLDTYALRRLLHAAPLLTVCDAALLDVCSVPDVRCMLRNEQPFEHLRLRALCVDFFRDDRRTDGQEDDSRNAAVIGLAAELGAHAWLKQLVLCNAYKSDYSSDDEDAGDDASATATIDALVDAALECGLESIRFVSCELSPDFLPALSRLVNGGTLTSLAIEQHDHLFDAPGTALFADAVRASSSLTTLLFWGNVIHKWWRDVWCIPVLMDALTGHGTLRTLCFRGSHTNQPYSVGSALGALVAANAPALTELDVSNLLFDDVTTRPLLDALAVNTHLRVLNINAHIMSREFLRDVLLPAVHANTGLRQLSATRMPLDIQPQGGRDFARAAEEVVAQRFWEVNERASCP